MKLLLDGGFFLLTRRRDDIAAFQRLNVFIYLFFCFCISLSPKVIALLAYSAWKIDKEISNRCD